MNGTFTQDTTTLGIEADTFEQAKEKVKALPILKEEHFILDDGEELSYYLEGEDTPRLNVVGHLKNKQLRVI